MSRLSPLFLLLLTTPAAAAPHLDLDLKLDPANRELNATAVLSEAASGRGLHLAHGLEITRLEVDGRPQPIPEAEAAGGWHYYRIGAGGEPPRQITVSYRGQLAPLADADHRQVLGRLPAMASPEGSYLPAGSGWYPDPGEPFTYHLRLTLPAGQKGLVAGTLSDEAATAEGYRAAYDFPHPAEGVDLMAGPYEVSERMLTSSDGQQIRLRTWFHPELANLAADYLADSARYLARYGRLIGPYPFSGFSIVSSPLPTGFGMPGLTYLGRQVLRLPFIRATSLGHEILHNWWGNGVYPDWERGNWSEGLTTFLADYAYKEDESAAAGREARLAWLRDLAAVPENEDSALATFTSRRHGISSIVGYNKAAMLFYMLRDRIGDDAFTRGLRLLWQEKRFRSASWADLEAAFSRASGRDLAAFFAQWVQRPGAPRIKLARAEQRGERVAVSLTQAGTTFALNVPIRLHYGERSEDRLVLLDGAAAEAGFTVNGQVEAVELDPDYRLWRRVDPAQFPAILREVFVAPRVGVVVIDDAAAVHEAALSLAGKVLEAEPTVLNPAAFSADRPLLILGSIAAVDAWVARQGWTPRPSELGGRGSAQIWAGRTAAGQPYSVVAARDAVALRALERGLPHYGRQSWLVFDGSRAIDKGVWPPGSERLKVRQSLPVSTSP